jgi:hypothetical protein
VIPNASVQLLANGLIKQGKLDGRYKIGYALEGLHTIRYSAPGYKTLDVPTNFITATTLTQVALLEPGVTGINDKEFENINVYPNTFIDYINIENKNLERFTASITDLNGKLLKSLDIKDSNNKIELDKLASGIYILQLSNKNYTKQYKLIKQ